MLAQDEKQADVFVLESPVISNGMFERMKDHLEGRFYEIDCVFHVGHGKAKDGALLAAIERVRVEAEDARAAGLQSSHPDRRAHFSDLAAIPMILATGAVHSYLVRQGLRTYTSINVRSAECLDTHYFAVLIGVGATTVNAYLAQDCIAERHARGLFGKMGLGPCVKRYLDTVSAGLLKIMSKMGIAVLSSYRGAYNFEAVGLSRSMVAEIFPGMSSRISGIGLSGIAADVARLHARAFDEDTTVLPIGGFYKSRQDGETHAHSATLIHLLQSAVTNDFLRHLPPLCRRREGAAAGHAAPSDGIPRRGCADPAGRGRIHHRNPQALVTPGMSLGALGPEAHEALNIAMNRIGAKSDSGEGGENPLHFKPKPNGDNANSAIKQVASGRFGVTAEYLNQCREIEIKVAQGAKPGEGGQLPGFKVTEMIAKLRHATPGVMLISPPPHHDIYSIEDLAQLIYDLKQINPDARVCVKLVAATGIGTIAAGVAKAKADVILISGHSGGTGASPQTSIKHAGVPWEMGLTEANQILTLNNLRHRVTLRTDGGIRTGRDVVMAAMMGAEEFGIGTASLIAMGCIMVRQCHSNTCPVGVCTQNEALRAKFTGTPEKVVNLFSFIAEDVREILASLGQRKLEDVIGRTDLIYQMSRGAEELDDLDLNPLLVQADPGSSARFSTRGHRNEVPDTLDALIEKDAAAFLDHGEKMQLAYGVRNTMRSIGARTSSHIVRRWGMTGLPPARLTLRLSVPAASRSARSRCRVSSSTCSATPTTMSARDCPGRRSRCARWCRRGSRQRDNTIIGNTVLYGATSGQLYAAGTGGRALRRAQFRRDRRDRRLRLQRLRIHDGGHGRDPRPHRRQFRRRHDRRHGLRLRRGRAVRRAHQRRYRGVAADRNRALAGSPARADRRPPPRDRLGLRHRAARAFRPRARHVLASRSEGDGRPPCASAERSKGRGRIIRGRRTPGFLRPRTVILTSSPSSSRLPCAPSSAWRSLSASRVCAAPDAQRFSSAQAPSRHRPGASRSCRQPP